MIHNYQRTATVRRLRDGPVDADGDLGAVAHGDRAILLADLVRDRAGDVPQMVLLAERSGAVRAETGVRLVPVVRVGGLRVPDRVAG